MNKDIESFAEDMQFKMDKNKRKPCPVMNPNGDERSYDHLSTLYCIERIKEELEELEEALREENYREAQLECADVGNFAMFLHANLRNLINVKGIKMKNYRKKGVHH